MKKPKSRAAILSVLLIGILIFAGVYYAYNTVTEIFQAAASGPGKPIHIEIIRGENAAQIGDDLQTKGLIRNSLAFRIWARIKGLDNHLEAGIYTQLNSSMTVSDIIDKLLNALPDAIRVTIPEGWRIEQIAKHMANVGLTRFNEKDFLSYTQHINKFPDTGKFPVLFNGVPTDNSMEGLLFPASYEIPVDASARSVVNLLLQTMSDTITQNHLDQMAQKKQLTVYQMLILASIVEREALFNSDRAGIAGVYWNRIYKANTETNQLLQADPTVQYGRDTQTPPLQYWLPLNDVGSNIAKDSPWNTYAKAGFPPTPICSPGLASLRAAAGPANSDFYFFLSKKDGTTVFAKTYQEFLDDQQKYLK